MPRKFLSFLGAIPYAPTRYYFDGDPSDLAAPTPYVQSAIFEKVLHDWQPGDQVLIFTTDDAQHKNYPRCSILLRLLNCSNGQLLHAPFCRVEMPNFWPL